MERLRKLLAGVKTDEDSDFENEDNGPEDNLEDNFSNHESFSEHDTKSENDVDSGNEEVNISAWFSSKDGVKWRKTKFRQNIRTHYHKIMSRLTKEVTSPMKSWELFIHVNLIQLITD
ncbi:hypothetical protein AVEN_20462-1, partial [Araneus ventricosus]